MIHSRWGGEGASRHWEILFYVSRSVFPLSFLVISPQTWLKFGIMVMPSLEQNDQKFLSSCQKPLYLTMSVGLSFLYLSYLAGRLSRWYMLSITNFFYFLLNYECWQKFWIFKNLKFWQEFWIFDQIFKFSPKFWILAKFLYPDHIFIMLTELWPYFQIFTKFSIN